MRALGMNGHEMTFNGVVDRAIELQEEVKRLRAALVEATAEAWYYRSEDRAYIYSWAETDDHIRDDYRLKARKSLALDGLVPLDH